MPINFSDYEEDGPAFAWHDQPECDDYWPFDEGDDMPPYDGPYHPYEDGYTQIGAPESFGRAGPSRDVVEPAGEATESTGRAGPSRDVVEPAGGSLSDPRIDIVGHKCIKVPTEPGDECRICMDTFHDESNPAVSAFKCIRPHLLHAECAKLLFVHRERHVCPYCRAPPGHPTLELIHGGTRRFYIGHVNGQPIFVET